MANRPAPTFNAADPIVLGANPLVGLNRRQVAAALGRLTQRAMVEPGVVTANMLRALGELVGVVVGRSDVAPDPRDKRFAHPRGRRTRSTTGWCRRTLSKRKRCSRSSTRWGSTRRAASGPASR